jgi:endothelin-converting enzyme
MTRYKPAEFVDEDTSSIGSIQINETTKSPTMHIRYHTARGTSLWYARNKLEKALLITVGLMILVIVILIAIMTNDSKRILHVQPHVDTDIYKG